MNSAANTAAISYQIRVIEIAYSGAEVNEVRPLVSGKRAKARAISEAKHEAAVSSVRKVIVNQVGGKMRGLEVYRHENPNAVSPPRCTSPSDGSAAERIMAELRAMRPGFYA